MSRIIAPPPPRIAYSIVENRIFHYNRHVENALKQKSHRPIAELMNRSVVVVSADESLERAVALMQSHRISSLVITRLGRPEGIFTERDLLRTIKRGKDVHDQCIRDYMTESVITASIDTDIYEAFSLFDAYGIRHLVITDPDGFVAGVVSQSDLMNSLGVEHFVEIKKVSSIMSPRVLMLGPDDTVFDGVSSMSANNISCIVVADDGKRPLGILTERDIVDLFMDRVSITERKLKDAMSSPVRTIPVDIAAHEAARTFNDYRLRRLVVVDEQGVIAGIVTQRDFIRGPMKEGYQGVLLEIIQRKERQIKEARAEVAGKELYENILRSLTEPAITAMDLGFRVLYFNAAAAGLLKYNADDVIGRTVMQIHAGAMVSPAGFMEALNAVCDNGQYTYIMRIGTPDDAMTVESTVSCMFDTQGKLSGYLMLSRPRN